jgi:hypothetical protein
VIQEKAAVGRLTWRYLIIDEAHRIKNEQSVLSRVVPHPSPCRPQPQRRSQPRSTRARHPHAPWRRCDPQPVAW